MVGISDTFGRNYTSLTSNANHPTTCIRELATAVDVDKVWKQTKLEAPLSEMIVSKSQRFPLRP
jgi:hypothetical protein